MSLDQVNKLLLGLSAEELSEVRNRCSVLLQGGAMPSAPTGRAAKAGRLPNADAELILSVISDFFREQGIEYAGIEKLRSMANYRAFEQKVPASMEYFRKVSSNRTKQRALIRMGCRMLYQDLQRMNVSASVRTVMNHWHRVPAVINKNFPGYAAAGLLGLLLREGSAVERYVYQDQQAEGEADD